MEKSSGVPVRSAKTILWTLAALVFMATAAVAPPSEAADGDRRVTSHISSTASRGAPIAVIDRTDIELSGMSNVWDLLVGRLKYNSFGLRRPFVVSDGRIAILINGRRISDSRLMGHFNPELDSLPISAVERIEILSDSAAGLHGGHAIAGAVNIVLKRALDGVEVRASHEQPGQRGGDAVHGSAFWGRPLGTGRLLVGADLFQRQEIRDADRAYSRASWKPDGSFAETGGVSVGGNTLIGQDNGMVTARALGDCEGSAYTGVLNKPYGLEGTGCGFAWADIAWGWESLERKSVFLDIDYPSGEDTELYVNGRFMQGDTAFRYAPSVGAFSFTPSAQLQEKLDGYIPFVRGPPVRRSRQPRLARRHEGVRFHPGRPGTARRRRGI